MALWAASLLALLLVLAFVAVAALVEARGAGAARDVRLRRGAYALALGVYCSSWTFYGAVGTLVREGWNYLPIYLAPVLVLLAAPRFFAALGRAVASEQATTVSDFIAARFRNDIVVARLVTTIALLGSIPYIALQLRSIGRALSLVSSVPVEVPAMIISAALLALFTVLYGARRFELAGRSEGLLFAIGFDSAFKFVALTIVAVLAGGIVLTASHAAIGASVERLGAMFRPERVSIETGAIFLVSGLAIISLPRQFYMGMVEARDPGDFVRARFVLCGYIAFFAVLAVPIALAGMAMLPTEVEPDLYVLALPAAEGSRFVVACALLGGIGAAASMAVVDATALATMVSNDLVLLSVVRRSSTFEAGSIGRRMLLVRRLSIVVIMALALAWGLLLPAANSLASIGLIAFAAMAQYTPHLILAANGRDRDPLAARASLATGLVLWLYTLALPPILPPAVLAALAATPLDPLHLFNLGNASPVVHGIAWSLGANLCVHLLLAARTVAPPALPRLMRGPRPVMDIGGLVSLIASFVGQERAEAEFAGVLPSQPVDRRAARRAQELIARVVGASSANTLVASALARGTMSLAEVTRLLDEGGQSLRFSRQLLAATFENINAGISVVDSELNLVAWNTRYLELFDYPPGLVRVGRPIADLIRYNAERNDFGPGDIEFHVAKRLDHLHRGVEHSFERHRSDGRVIKTVGGPMPGGGYVTSFIDITEEARVREELSRTLEALEDRVEARTRELSDANGQLAQAARDKTRFLAAASHDLLQPLHAARLFAAALDRDLAPAAKPLLERLDLSIVAAEDLLRALLEISKLDAGAVEPQLERIELDRFVGDLVETMRPAAEAKGLSLRLGPLMGSVESDSGLLRSVLQNFVSNAVRYTSSGGVLIGMRRRDEFWRIDVVDTGIGIPPERIAEIFSEFTRLGEVDVEGFGLGLALVERLVRLLGGRIEVQSVPERGSRFSLYLRAAEPSASVLADRPPLERTRPVATTAPLDVLVIDDDPLIVEATVALLTGLGHRTIAATGRGEALGIAARPDAVLADYALGSDDDGLSVIAALRDRWPGLAAALVTAEQDPAIRILAAAEGIPVIGKPARPAAIREFLADVSMTQV